MKSLHNDLLTECIALARTALRLGEAPIAAVIARSDGSVIGWGWNEMKAKRDPTLHAEIAAFRDAAGRYDAGEDGLILVSTLEPCIMCTGAAILCNIATIVYALPAPADSGMGRIAAPSSPGAKMPSVVGPARQAEVRSLFEQWLTLHPHDHQQGDYVRQLLAIT